MTAQVSDSEHFTQRLVPVAGVALAGIIQVSGSSGPFDLWNVMIGVPLVLLLAAYAPGRMRCRERVAWSATWGFTLTSACGVLFQAAYRSAVGRPGVLPPFPEGNDWEAPSAYYFAIWLVLSVTVFACLGRAPKPKKKVMKEASPAV